MRLNRKRINIDLKNVFFDGNGVVYNKNYPAFFNGDIIGFEDGDTSKKIKFNFFGDRIKIIDAKSTSRGIKVIKIDEQEFEYDTHANPTQNIQNVVFEKTGLALKEHIVEIGLKNGSYLTLDAIDLPSYGKLLPYNPNPCKILLKQKSKIYSIREKENGVYKVICNDNEATKETYEKYGFNPYLIADKEELNIIKKQFNDKFKIILLKTIK